MTGQPRGNRTRVARVAVATGVALSLGALSLAAKYRFDLERQREWYESSAMERRAEARSQRELEDRQIIEHYSARRALLLAMIHDTRLCPEGKQALRGHANCPCVQVRARAAAALELVRIEVEFCRARSRQRDEYFPCDHDLRGVQLPGADLRGADLSLVVLANADLRGADLRGAKLLGTDLTKANLNGANLEGSDLEEAWLEKADLRDANLRDVDLTRARLHNAGLGGADLTGATLHYTQFPGADLRGAKGLTQDQLRGGRNLPSSVPVED